MRVWRRQHAGRHTRGKEAGEGNGRRWRGKEGRSLVLEHEPPLDGVHPGVVARRAGHGCPPLSGRRRGEESVRSVCVTGQQRRAGE